MTGPVIKPWFELWLEVPSHWAEDVGALLIDEGASGVTETTPENVSNRALVAASFAATSRPKDLVAAGERVLGELGIDKEGCPLHVVFRQDAEWAERWKDFFRPLRLGSSLWIVPSWEKTFLPPRKDHVLVLDPGLAFGTGQHPTTALTLELMEKAIDLHRPYGPVQVLDVGTGSGILAMAAVRLGAVRSLGIDNDPEAVRCAGENVLANRLGRTVQIAGTDLTAVKDRFSVIVANILAPTLIHLAPALIARLAPHGTLIVSGILQGEEKEVSAALITASRAVRIAPLCKTYALDRADWMALSFGDERARA